MTNAHVNTGFLETRSLLRKIILCFAWFISTTTKNNFKKVFLSTTTAKRKITLGKSAIFIPYHEDIVYAIDRAVSRICKQKSRKFQIETGREQPRASISDFCVRIA